MTLIKRNSNYLPTFPRLFDDFFTKDLFDWEFNNFSAQGTSLPRVNIVETDEAFEVEMAAPGLDKKDFLIELNNEMLTIAVEKEVRNEGANNHHFVRQEFTYDSFKRTFHLPKKVVDESKIEASYRDGLLSIMIPKKEALKVLPPRIINIK